MSRRPVLVVALALFGVGLATAAPAVAPHPERVVVGAHDWLFLAQDWRVPCQDAGGAERVAHAVSDLATALQAGGRSVVLVLGPDKSTVVRRQVPRSGLPDGACGDRARQDVWRALTRSGGPRFLDLRPALATAARGPRDPYWKKDTHWTPTGGAVYAEQLAARLAPGVRSRLTRRTGTCARHGDLARDLGRPDLERVPCAVVVDPGVDVEQHGYWSVGTSQPALWSSAVGPPGAVVPGRTVVLGDSFSSTAYDSLTPLFEDLLLFHPGHDDDDIAPVVRQLRDADTVVIEVVERFAERYRAFAPDVVAAVRRLPPRVGPPRPGPPPGTPFGCGCGPLPALDP